MSEWRDSCSMKEAHIVIESWCVEYNTRRPHFDARLQATCPRGLQPLGSKSNFTAHGCAVIQKLSHFDWTKPSGWSGVVAISLR